MVQKYYNIFILINIIFRSPIYCDLVQATNNNVSFISHDLVMCLEHSIPSINIFGGVIRVDEGKTRCSEIECNEQCPQLGTIGVGICDLFHGITLKGYEPKNLSTLP